jgi:hypothetical protein
MFPSDCIPKVTKDVNVYFFIHSSNSFKLYQQMPVNYTSEFQELFKLLCTINVLKKVAYFYSMY